MKCFKYFLILVMVVILSGCSAGYKLTITDSYIDEDISAVFENNSTNLELANMDYNPLHYNNEVFYDKKVDIKEENIYLNLHFRYNFLEFRDADSYNIPFESRNVKYENNILYINCKNLKNFSANVDFDIKIKTDNKVLKHNADNVKGNTYIWHVKYKDKDKLNVNIKIRTNKLSNFTVLKKVFICVFIVVLFIGAIILIYSIARSRNKKNNRI